MFVFLIFCFKESSWAVMGWVARSELADKCPLCGCHVLGVQLYALDFPEKSQFQESWYEVQKIRSQEFE